MPAAASGNAPQTEASAVQRTLRLLDCVLHPVPEYPPTDWTKTNSSGSRFRFQAGFSPFGGAVFSQERNKPLAPPKKPAAAPFFLPTVSDVAGNIAFDLDKVVPEEEQQPKSKLLRNGTAAGAALSEFAARVKAGHASGDYAHLVQAQTRHGQSLSEPPIRFVYGESAHALCVYVGLKRCLIWGHDPYPPGEKPRQLIRELLFTAAQGNVVYM